MINNKKLNSPLAQLIKNEPALMSVLKDGDLIESRLLKKASRQVYFDLGSFGTGIVYGVELTNAQTIIKGLNAGDSVSAKIVDPENEDGYVEISLSEAAKQKIWQGIKELQEKGEVFSDKLIMTERETASQNIKALLDNYKAGDVVDGIISGVANFGAFMRFTDNPQIEGLIHISELDHRLIENPKEIVKVDDAVKAKILKYESALRFG